MAIQRAAPMPIPPEEAARLRGSLAPEYGAEVWEGPERRVLVIRVPRADPDPVNDVEAAVEHLQPGDVEDLTHCLLMGDQRVAQVYVRPLHDLMKDRLAFDARQAAHWRQELPGQLGHALFQSPEDPRRRWRLAVRLPCASVAEVEEEHFDDLVEGIGPLLETPRFKQLVAVYFIAANDHLRLSAHVFLGEMGEKWVSEERIRRKEEEERKAEEADRSRAAAEKRRQEAERIALLKEVDRKMARYQAERAVGGPIPDAPPEPEDRSTRPDRLLVDEQETTLVARPPERPKNPRGPWTVTDVEQPEGPAHSADALLERAAADTIEVPKALLKDVPQELKVSYDTDAAVADLMDKPGRLASRLEALRARVDNALENAPGPARTEPVRRSRSSIRRESIRDPVLPRSRDVPRPEPRDPKGRLQARLESSGYDVLSSPPIAGHQIDFAAERPSGSPQRVVARLVPRLDITVAKQLLKTARELEVDLVLCVAEHVDAEAQRLLVATKIKVARPADVAAYRF